MARPHQDGHPDTLACRRLAASVCITVSAARKWRLETGRLGVETERPSGRGGNVLMMVVCCCVR